MSGAHSLLINYHKSLLFINNVVKNCETFLTTNKYSVLNNRGRVKSLGLFLYEFLCQILGRQASQHLKISNRPAKLCRHNPPNESAACFVQKQNAIQNQNCFCKKSAEIFRQSVVLKWQKFSMFMEYSNVHITS